MSIQSAFNSALGTAAVLHKIPGKEDLKEAMNPKKMSYQEKLAAIKAGGKNTYPFTDDPKANKEINKNVDLNLQKDLIETQIEAEKSNMMNATNSGEFNSAYMNLGLAYGDREKLAMSQAPERAKAFTELKKQEKRTALGYYPDVTQSIHKTPMGGI